MNLLIVIGTRPNFIKVTQFKKLAKACRDLNLKIVHTGQHFDSKMADVFFKQFELVPDYFLNVPQVSPNSQMAEIMLRLESLIHNDFKPDLMIVVGDVNSTLAAAITANKLGIKLAHLESGLRSFDKTMPEEHNRVLTDALTDIYFVTEPDGLKNLKNEGVEEGKIKFVGNTMIDTLVAYSSQIDQSKILEELNLTNQPYVLMTMHRPATVDNKEGLLMLNSFLSHIGEKYKIVFPIHPRTLKKMDEFGLKKMFTDNLNLLLTDPLDYFAFQKLIKHSRFIVTDSGGIQEESTFSGIPCLTLRPNTERPVTVTTGTNTLLPFDLELLKAEILSIELGTYKKGKIPEFWDGKSTQRIINLLVN